VTSKRKPPPVYEHFQDEHGRWHGPNGPVPTLPEIAWRFGKAAAPLLGGLALIALGVAALVCGAL
jgi:hypothetical protein